MFRCHPLVILALLALVLGACAPAAPSPTAAPAKPATTTAPAATTAPSKPVATTAAPAKPAKLDKFVYGIVSYNPLHTVMMVASERKSMEKFGIDLEVVLTQSSPAAVAGLVGGSVDATTTTVEAAFPMQAQNPDVKILLGFVVGSPYILLSRTDINTIADLKGKTMGSTALKSGADTVALRTVLRKHGLVDEKDYTIVVVGSVAERAAAMKAGTVSAVANLEPQVSQLKAEGFKVLDDALTYTELQGIFSGVIVAKQSNYKAKEDLFNRFMKGYIDASKYVNDPANKNDVIAILQNLLKTTPEFATNTYNRFVPNKLYPNVPRVDMEILSKTARNAKTLETPGIPDALEPYIDNSLIDKAAKEMP